MPCVRIRMNSVSVIGRNTQGVTLIGCNEGERVIGAVRVVDKQDDDDIASDDELSDEIIDVTGEETGGADE